MNVLFTHDNHFVRLDGKVYSLSQFPASLWKRYLKHFDSVTVLGREVQMPQGKPKSDLELSSARGVSFAYGPCLSSLKAQLVKRRKAQAVVRKLLSSVDVVIARLPSELGLMAAKEARCAGVPWAVEVAGCPWDGFWNYGTWQGKAYAPIMACRMRSAVSKAPFALYVTNAFLQRRYPNKHGITTACSNVVIDPPSITVLEARKRNLTEDKRKIVLGLIGTLKTRYKGIQTVFEALAKSRGRLPPIQFRILGAGDVNAWKDEAEGWGVNDIVRFDGTRAAGGPVMAWLDEVDLYLQPSFQEGLPRALIEAMSRGCPAVGSKCAGIPELLEPECVIKPGDAEHLGELLVSTVTDTEWKRQQAQRNWDVAKEYSEPVLTARRTEFWDRFAKYAERVNAANSVSHPTHYYSVHRDQAAVSSGRAAGVRGTSRSDG